jgi:uncharacterized protein GlcG (DUF336 family)
MRLHVLIALGISSALVLGTAALAQQPAPSTPPASPGTAPVPPPDYGPPITNEQAKAVAAAAFAEAKKNNWRMAFAIVGADQYAAGNTAFTTFTEQPVASEGGIPIVVSGKIVGAIGASGGTGQQDGMAAAAGVGAAK